MSDNFNIQNVISKIKSEVSAQSDYEHYIPNIIEFCESKYYLNMPGAGINLFPMQKVILKCFYRGQLGNEDLYLTRDEIQLLYDNKLDGVLEKYHSEELFRELILVLGRRCISEDSTIFDAIKKESKTIRQWHNECDKLNVWTLNELTKQYEINPAEIIDQGHRECQRVTLENQQHIDCTDNHPLLTTEGWKEVSNLKIGDKIATSVDVPKIDANLVYKTIISIKGIGEQHTFDLSIGKDHCNNFIANSSIVCHNSGKDFMTSLIALYETMKLLETPGGSPFTYYNMATGNPIYIVTIATSAGQARILFNEMKTRIYGSKYFMENMPDIASECMWCMTPEDKLIKKKLIDEGFAKKAESYKGSIVIMSGHSNSESLLGKRYFCLLFDEVASYKTSGGAASGERLYSALGPGTADFTRVIGYDENNKPIKQTDSKIVSISSPRSEQGILFKLYNDTPETKGRLSFKLPTWKVNGKYDEDSLRKEHKYMTPNEFNMEFGAQFAGTAGEKFIPDQYVDDAIEIGTELGLDQREVGVQGISYYLHLDPAATSNNYALVMMHVEERIREKENAISGRRETEKYKLFVVDHIKVWQPQVGKAIDVYEVDRYVIDLHRRFRLALVTYDTFNYLASVQRMRAKGIPTKVTPFRKQYKIQIYQHLYNLLVAHQIALPRRGPHASMLEMELKCLKRIYTNNGFKICPDDEAQVKTDDVADALAGACGVACEDIFAGYPKSVTVNTTHKSASQQSWQIGQGSYTDQQWKHYARKFGW